MAKFGASFKQVLKFWKAQKKWADAERREIMELKSKSPMDPDVLAREKKFHDQKDLIRKQILKLPEKYLYRVVEQCSM